MIRLAHIFKARNYELMCHCHPSMIKGCTPPSMEGVVVCTLTPPHLSRNSNLAPYFSFENVCFCPPPPPPPSRNFHSVVEEEAQSVEVSWGVTKGLSRERSRNQDELLVFFCPLYVCFRLLILRRHVLILLQSGWMTPYLYLKPFLVSKWPLILLEVVIR